MKYVSLSKLRDYYYCPTRAYLRYICGISFPPTPEMERGTKIHSFFGSLWRQVIAIKDKVEIYQALPEFVNAYAIKHNLNSSELLNIASKRLDLIWTYFGKYIETGSLNVLSEQIVKSKELGLVGRIDFVYNFPDKSILGELKTGQPHEFDKYQLNAYFAMHHSAKAGFIEYLENFEAHSLNNDLLGELLQLKQKFEDQEFSRPKYSSKCEYCQYRRFCFGRQ